MTKFASLSFLLVLTFLVLTGCSISKVMRVENREVIAVDTMIDELRSSPLVFVGERHTSAAHHKLQLEILKRLKAEGKPVAIAMEMFEGGSQRALDAWCAGKVPEDAIRKVYEWNWRNIPWSLYRDILVFARDNKIPIIALNPPREIVHKVSRSGFSSLGAADLRQLPEGVDATVSDNYLNFISSAYAFHGRNGSAFRYLCEAQMLRNRVMARRISDYLMLHPGTVMVVLAGGGHAREKGGVPAELDKLPYKIVLPPIPTLTAETITLRDGDYLLEEPFWWLEEIF